MLHFGTLVLTLHQKTRALNDLGHKVPTLKAHVHIHLLSQRETAELASVSTTHISGALTQWGFANETLSFVRGL